MQVQRLVPIRHYGSHGFVTQFDTQYDIYSCFNYTHWIQEIWIKRYLVKLVLQWSSSRYNVLIHNTPATMCRGMPLSPWIDISSKLLNPSCPYILEFISRNFSLFIVQSNTPGTWVTEKNWWWFLVLLSSERTYLAVFSTKSAHSGLHRCCWVMSCK